MARPHWSFLAALAIALPALGTAAAPYFSNKDSACFSIAGSGYRLTAGRNADYTVKIDEAAAQPDLTVQIVDDPSGADFVLVDGADNSSPCSDMRSIRTIRIDSQTRDADLTIVLGSSAGAYKIYAQSTEFSAQQAAALFAVIRQAGHKRNLAAR